MNPINGSVGYLFEKIRIKAPEYLDLLTANTEEVFDEALFGLIEKALFEIEKNKKEFQNLTENALTSILAGFLMIPGLSVFRENNSGGHVDITIVADHCPPVRTRLGEAKIYDGFSYHIKGLKQLIERDAAC